MAFNTLMASFRHDTLAKPLLLRGHLEALAAYLLSTTASIVQRLLLLLL